MLFKKLINDVTWILSASSQEEADNKFKIIEDGGNIETCYI